MNQQKLDAGRELVDHLKSAAIDVTAAFWAQESYDESWYLYIASSLVDSDGPARAYSKVYGELLDKPEIVVAPSEIKLIGAKSPLAAEVVAIQNRGNAPLDTRYRGRQLGDLFIDDAYFYHVK